MSYYLPCDISQPFSQVVNLRTFRHGCIMATMKPTPTTAKMWVETRRKLQRIASITDELLVEIMDRLATEELNRLTGETHDQIHSPKRPKRSGQIRPGG